jgi:hypothetical protein
LDSAQDCASQGIEILVYVFLLQRHLKIQLKEKTGRKGVDETQGTHRITRGEEISGEEKMRDKKVSIYKSRKQESMECKEDTNENRTHE